VSHACERGVSERHACHLLGQPRGTQRYRPTQREDEDRLTQAIVALASQYGRYGYRRITALLLRAGWKVGKDRVERIWRREGLKVPQRQKPRGRLWLNDGSCVRLRPTHPNHVWSYDFVSARTHDGRSVRMLNLIDESTRECLLIRAERRWSSAKVIGALADVMVLKGVPEHLRSDNGPEFVAKDLRKWLADTGAKTLYIEPGSPWENGISTPRSKLRGDLGTANRSTRSFEMSSSTASSSTRSKNCVCWPSAGASTTTQSGRTLRWATDHQHQRHG
jgi:putative transposase